jgi:EAL domain-containing protein (putative c-di-GMP-specific phosphodiesterase class I)
MVSPAEFIPLAEQGGLIDALGRWVLARACAEAAHWPAPLSVAVNLSPVQFRRGDALVADIRAALAASGLAPQRLEVEITESLLMANTEPVLAALRALHDDGVRIAMDDFGTGYSSLAYLWRFPFDKVKIDGAFTRGLGSDDGKAGVVVHAIVSLAHALGIKVNAEGVETEAQRAALVRAGCDELQGWLLGRPAPPHELPHHGSSGAAPPAPMPLPAETYLISQRTTDPATRP